MTVEQQSTALGWFVLAGVAEHYLRTGTDNLTDAVTMLVPRMIADLDDLAKKLEQG